MPGSDNDNPFEWYAVRVRTRAETTVNQVLRSRDIETLCPTYKSSRIYSDRVKNVEQALFPGYLFCRINWSDRLPILSTPGVDSIVGFGREPHPVDPLEMQALQAVLRAGLLAHPHKYLRVGQRVRVEAGPLANMEGILVAAKNEFRLVLSVSLLQRSISVEVDRAIVSPA